MQEDALQFEELRGDVAIIILSLILEGRNTDSIIKKYDLKGNVFSAPLLDGSVAELVRVGYFGRRGTAHVAIYPYSNL